jgi:hypothetical protein
MLCEFDAIPRHPMHGRKKKGPRTVKGAQAAKSSNPFYFK